jgi:hypothetical protein
MCVDDMRLKFLKKRTNGIVVRKSQKKIFDDGKISEQEWMQDGNRTGRCFTMKWTQMDENINKFL